MAGATIIEFIQPMSEGPSIFTETLREQGEGAMHHFYPAIRPLTAAGYDALCTGYDAQGLEKTLDFEVPGIGRNCFYDARHRIGCYIEVLEVTEAAFDLVYKMRDAHLVGPGGRPLRDAAELM